MKRGRQSPAELSVVSINATIKPIDPPDHLSSKEAKLFREITASVHPGHFVASDVHLLCAFVQATLVARDAMKDLPDLLALWDRSTKLQATLATRLRLSPQSRADFKVVARMARDHKAVKDLRPWEDE